MAARTVMIIHEESLFGTGTANLLAKELPGFGFEVKEVVKHANPTRDFNNIVLRMKAVNPDIVIPANYYNEYALLVRTMQQQKVTPKAIYSVLGGAASSYKFLKEFPEAANGIIDCNHWFNPKDKRAHELKKRTEAKGLFYSYEVFNTYTAVRLLADAIDRAKSADREAITAALAASTFSDHFMPYGPTKFENGQNTGAQPLMTQVIKGDIRVIVPREYREIEHLMIVQTALPDVFAYFDDLAARFIANGWSLKWLHREIMLSATYRQASNPRPDVAKIDPANRLLWRMNPRRLDIEAYRDCILQAAGKLDTKLGGPSTDIEQSTNQRRTVYGRVSRGRTSGLLILYGFPEATMHSPGRQTTTTPIQPGAGALRKASPPPPCAARATACRMPPTGRASFPRSSRPP